MPFGNKKKGDIFSSVLSQFKKYHPFGNLKFIYLSISQSLKLRNSMEKILPISLEKEFHSEYFGLLWVKAMG